MTPVLSPNTQAILLLTAPLIAGRGSAPSELLSPSEYKRLARHLREIHRQPADLLLPEAAQILRACQPVIDESRMQKLLGRGFLLSQVIEHWQARAIWVVSRADAGYPRRLKMRLREDAPAVLYGCGDMALLETGGLAVVGSRDVDDALINYTMSVGQLAARADRTIVSGGAKGTDLAAMRGAIESGGRACGVLPGDLEKMTMNREHRDMLIDGRLVLVSSYDPSARFKGWQAMQRNKLIYALADAALVVESSIGSKSGTWSGAVEQLDKLKFVPVFIRSTSESSAGLDGLRKKGALPWPNPQDVDSFEDVFNVAIPTLTVSQQVGTLFSNEESTSADTKPTSPVPRNAAPDYQVESESSILIGVVSDVQPPAMASEELLPATPETVESMDGAQASAQPELAPADVLFAAVRAVIQQLLSTPMREAEVALALEVSNTQAKAWLQRMVGEGTLAKQNRPVRYAIKKRCCLFD